MRSQRHANTWVATLQHGKYASIRGSIYSPGSGRPVRERHSPAVRDLSLRTRCQALRCGVPSGRTGPGSDGCPSANWPRTCGHRYGPSIAVSRSLNSVALGVSPLFLFLRAANRVLVNRTASACRFTGNTPFRKLPRNSAGTVEHPARNLVKCLQTND